MGYGKGKRIKGKNMNSDSTKQLKDEDGYELWLRYHLIDNSELLTLYRESIQQIKFNANSPTLEVAYAELIRGLQGLLGIEMVHSTEDLQDGALLCGTPNNSQTIADLNL